MMTDLECQQEEHDFICWLRDIEQGCEHGDLHGISRPADEPWEDEE